MRKVATQFGLCIKIFISHCMGFSWLTEWWSCQKSPEQPHAKTAMSLLLIYVVRHSFFVYNFLISTKNQFIIRNVQQSQPYSKFIQSIIFHTYPFIHLTTHLLFPFLSFLYIYMYPSVATKQLPHTINSTFWEKSFVWKKKRISAKCSVLPDSTLSQKRPWGHKKISC